MKAFGVLLYGGLVSLVLAGGAFAQSPSGHAYGGAGGEIEQGVQGSGVASGGTLPFTGLDLGIAIAAGLALLAVGLLMRRLATSR